MPCGRSADIYLSGDAIDTCLGNHIGFYLTYIPQLEGTKMFINKHNDHLVRCLNGENIRLNVQFFDKKDNKDGSVVTSNVDLPSDDFANYPQRVEWQAQKIDAVCDKDYSPVGIIFGPESTLACAFKDILKQRGIKVCKLPTDDNTWSTVFGGANYVCDADDEELPGLYDHLVSILTNLGYIEPEYKCEKKEDDEDDDDDEEDDEEDDDEDDLCGGAIKAKKSKSSGKNNHGGAIKAKKSKSSGKNNHGDAIKAKKGGEMAMAKVMEMQKAMQKTMPKEKAMQMHQGGEKKNNSSMKGLLKKLNTLVDKL